MGVKKIFLSYRHDDSGYITGRIHDHLSRAFGEEVIFFDAVKSLPLGCELRDYIGEAAAEVKVMLVIIGKQWANIKDAGGNIRLEKPDDWVRLEVEAGLSRGKKFPIIPIFVESSSLDENQLPDPLKPLAKRLGKQVRTDPDFKKDIEDLIQDLTNYAGPVRNLDTQAKLLLEELQAIHNFDLEELINICINHLMSHHQGVIGFGLPCNIPRLPENICERMRIRLYCDCEIKDSIVLDRSYAAGIDRIVDDFLRAHKAAGTANTIFTIQTRDNVSAATFWRCMKANEGSLPDATRLILLKVVEEDFEFPPDLIRLPPPKFQPAQVQEFFMKVTSARKPEWSSADIQMAAEYWVQSLTKYCTTSSGLDQRLVYSYLDTSLKGFRKSTEVNEFTTFLSSTFQDALKEPA